MRNQPESQHLSRLLVASTRTTLFMTILLSLFTNYHLKTTLAQQLFHQHNNNLHYDVLEATPNNTYIGNIKSADNQHPYLILPAHPTPEFELIQAFRIDLSNGNIYTNSLLDREHRETYHFVAIVREPFAEIKCTITVRDINDNAPMFLLGGQTNNNNNYFTNESNFVIEVPEGQRGVRRVLPLAVDVDTPQFGIKEFRIVSGNTPSGTFQLVEHEAPARSTLNPSLSQLSQADDAASSLSALDNPRIQEQLNAQAVVLIPSQPQSSISGPISTASNTPSTSNLPSSNSLTGSRFLIDLEVSQTLDRENQSSYQLVVEAIDGGQPPLIGRLLVSVNVQDANDNDPVFTKKVYESHVPENAAKGTVLTRVQAYDADLDANAKISYFIRRQHNNTAYSNYPSNFTNSNLARSRANNNGFQLSTNQQLSAEWFEIDQEKGEIYLVNQLDYEQDQMHEFIVEARDHGKPPRSSYATIKVFVNDVNDDPPALPISQQSNGLERQNNLNSATNANLATINKVPNSAELKKNSAEFHYSSDNGNRQATFFQGFNVAAFVDQMNPLTLFSIVLIALLLLALPVCLVKIKSKKPETDHYNDTAGLTLSPNGQQTKQSPNHYLSQDRPDHHHSLGVDDQMHRHHGVGLGDHQHHSATGTIGHPNALSGQMFGSLRSEKQRYHSAAQYSDQTSNLYHNPYPTSRNIHRSTNKEGTIDSLGNANHFVQRSTSPTPATPNTHSSGLPANLHEHQVQHSHSHQLLSIPPPPTTAPHFHHHHHHHQSHLPSPQESHKPTTPGCNGVGPPPSAFNFPSRNRLGVNNGGTMATTCGVTTAAMAAMSAANSFSPLAGRAASNTTLDGSLSDMNAPSQLVYSHDWADSYNWDYLTDWTPEYQSLMQLFSAS